MSQLKKAKAEFKEVLPHLIKEFNIDFNNIKNDLPSFGEKEDIVNHYNHDFLGDDPIAYVSRMNAFVINEETLGTQVPLNKPLMGEETSHWLRVMTDDGYKTEEDIDWENDKVKDYWKNETVMEFLGGIAALNIQEEFGGEIDEVEWGEWDIPQRFAGERASDIRRFYWDQKFDDYLQTDWHQAFGDRVNHEAGYTAAEELYEQALEDEELFYKSSNQIWQEYDLNQYELDAIRQITEEGE